MVQPSKKKKGLNYAIQTRIPETPVRPLLGIALDMRGSIPLTVHKFPHTKPYNKEIKNYHCKKVLN